MQDPMCSPYSGKRNTAANQEVRLTPQPRHVSCSLCQTTLVLYFPSGTSADLHGPNLYLPCDDNVGLLLMASFSRINAFYVFVDGMSVSQTLKFPVR